MLAAPGQDGVVTCITRPSPESIEATIPFESAQGFEHELPGQSFILG